MSTKSTNKALEPNETAIFGGAFPIPMPPAVTPTSFKPADFPTPANDTDAPHRESLLVKRRRRRNRLAGRHH